MLPLHNYNKKEIDNMFKYINKLRRDYKNKYNYSTFLCVESSNINTTNSISNNTKLSCTSLHQHNINKELEQLTFYKQQLSKYKSYNITSKVKEYQELVKHQELRIKKLKKLQSSSSSKFKRIINIIFEKS